MSDLHRRFVLYVETWGVFVGTFLGLGFWSKTDPVDQPCAPVFDTYEDAVAFMRTQTTPGGVLPVYKVVPVLTTKLDRASIAECVAAGLPPWDAPGVEGAA